MKKVAFLVLVFFVQEVFPADTFSFEMPDPRLRIAVPDIPQMKMEVHPNARMQPHARFMGSGGDYVLSVLTPTADAGMSALDCARSGSRGIIKRFGLDPKFLVGFQAAESTFVMLFPYRVDLVIQFKAFLLSGYQGTHCIEVHISRTVPAGSEQETAEALARWYQGFRSARIESY